MNRRSPRVRPLRERLREQTDAAILDATEHVLAHHGMTGASMQAIARQAGVAVGTLYNRFGDRDGMLRALVEARRAELALDLRQLLDAGEGEPFHARLVHFVAGVLRTADARKTFVRASLESELWRMSRRNGPPLVYEQLQAHARTLVAAGVEAGALAADHADLAALMLASILRGLMIDCARRDTPVPPEREAAVVVELFLRGAGPRA